MIGGLWLDFIAPWRYMTIGADRRTSTEAWSQYVINNYFFYHTLLGSLLDYVEVIVEGFGEVLGNSKSGQIDTEAIKSALLPLLVLLARILAAISPFSDLIREVELDELVVSKSGSQTFIRRTISTRGVKEQLSTLESERFTLLPLFGECSQQRALRIMYWFERIYSALPGPTDRRAEREAGIRHLSLENETTHHTTPPDSRSMIMQCEEELCAIFGIKENDFEDFSTRFEESRRMQAIIPNVSLRRRTIPAPLPDERVALKKQATKTATEAVDLVKSYESAFLVQLTEWISTTFNERYSIFITDRELPGFIKNIRINLRFLAAYPNIIFMVVFYFAIRIIFSVVH